MLLPLEERLEGSRITVAKAPVSRRKLGRLASEGGKGELSWLISEDSSSLVVGNDCSLANISSSEIWLLEDMGILVLATLLLVLAELSQIFMNRSLSESFLLKEGGMEVCVLLERGEIGKSIIAYFLFFAASAYCESRKTSKQNSY